MVTVKQTYLQNNAGPVDVDMWLQHIVLPYTDKKFLTPLKLAYTLGLATNEVAKRDEPIALISGSAPQYRGLAIAEILSDLHLDPEALIAAVTFNSMQLQNVTVGDIKQQLSENIAKLVEGVRKMEALHILRHDSSELDNSPSQLDKVRKMLLAMVEDVRVVLIKLAEHLCQLRHAKELSAKDARYLARQTQMIFAPLANRLGIGHVKWEMEDLAFRYLEPDTYKKIAGLLHERRLDREKYIGRVIDSLKAALQEESIDAEINGRAKHIYSIWRKMRRKNVEYSEIYDVRAVRVLVNSIRECYAALGIVHSLWQHIPKEFDDYVATPKKNGYSSLHTAVLGPDGKIVEVQIRTHEMHQDSELGVAAHWMYKEGHKQASSYENKVAWMRQLIDWHQEASDTDANDLIAELQANVLEDRVYVLTPRGDVVDLPIGSTPLDFAYQVHTLIGHRCRGVKINGRIVPLAYVLQTGDQVEVLTAPHAAPSRDWINPNLGYLKTPRARAKVHQWFKHQDRGQNIADGHMLLDKELNRLGLQSIDLPAALEKMRFKEADDLYAALGSGDIRTAQVLGAAKALPRVESSDEPIIPVVSKKIVKPLKADEITIQGVGNLLTQTARCCKPLPGDPIIGYITQGRGVSIHRQDCPNVLHVREKRNKRLIEVAWGTQQERTYPVDLYIQAYDRPGLLRDITTLLAAEKINVLALQTATNAVENSANSVITLEITDLTRLARVIEKLHQLPNVMEVKRKR